MILSKLFPDFFTINPLKLLPEQKAAQESRSKHGA